ncbi:hypothetical protein HS041_15605 [Planomonospora sp. ID67723]|uniref:hypothetical protein n=1 Tax=Planomonospora sp. ID67723 TaxID=2738134 RepID=UPI0018C35BF2|nr:hypothetical protein [Planomonospora sp. ID67723]MBG0829195.1 hypothetical protein [Planomonospora sp. ID67723]
MAAAAVTVPAHAAPEDVRLPGTSTTVREDSADRVRVTSYTVGKAVYLRRGTGFVRRSSDTEITVAPKGTTALAVPSSYTGGYDSVTLLDVATGRGTRIRTVRKPLLAGFARWSRDGGKAVLTVRKKTATGWAATGFVLVDAAAKSARVVAVPGVDPAARFRWSPDGADLVAGHRGGTRFYGQDGRVRRTLARTGTPAGGDDAFSPSGRRMTTWCPAAYAEHVCVWDRATGRLAARVNIRPAGLWGWWDDKHLIAVVARGGSYRAVVSDLRGGIVRVLAGIPSADWRNKLYLGYTRTS